MLDRLLPSPSAFCYKGSRYAPWLASVVVSLKIAIALGAIFNGHYAASVADGIPLDACAPDGARAILALFGNLGVSQLLLSGVGILIIARYRALLPAYLALLVAEILGRRLIAIALPIQRVGGSGGGAIAWAIVGLVLLALVLSMRASDHPGRAT